MPKEKADKVMTVVNTFHGNLRIDILEKGAILYIKTKEGRLKLFQTGQDTNLRELVNILTLMDGTRKY